MGEAYWERGLETPTAWWSFTEILTEKIQMDS